MKRMKLTKGKVLYKEGDIIKGIYVVDSGQLKYTKRVKYSVPLTNQTQNPWFTHHLSQLENNKKTVNKDIMVFESGVSVGFEELIRH
jgi:CRP-like cAMP-binding protein